MTTAVSFTAFLLLYKFVPKPRPTWRQALASSVFALVLFELARLAADTTGLALATCREYLGDLDYALSYRHLAGLTDFFRRLAQDGLVPDGSLSFISAA